jgi:hypothetical protein
MSVLKRAAAVVGSWQASERGQNKILKNKRRKSNRREREKKKRKMN